MLGYGVKETTATTGTGTLTLSAVTGFPRFADAFPTGTLVEYSLLTSAGLPIECGIGTVGASNTLARTYPLTTWTGSVYDDTTPSAISLTGTTTVICTGTPGAGFPFVQAMSTSATYKAMDSFHFSLNNSTTVAMIANRLYVVPFLSITNRPWAGIQCRVSVGSGTNGTLGLYRCGPAGLPTDLLQSGTISSGSSGVKQVAFSACYPPGWYYMTCVVDDNSVTINASAGVAGPSPLGHDSNNQHIVGLYTANGSLTPPNPWSGSPTVVANSLAIPSVSALYA